MNRDTESKDLGLCRAYVASHLEPERLASAPPEPGPAITISYQTGAGAHDIARHLAGVLQKDELSPAWTVFDRELVEKVLEEHHLPKALARHMPEERRSFIRDVMDELVGLRPPSWVMVPQIAETLLNLAEAGRVILVGRGANYIAARMPNVFHVRLISALPQRIERVQRQENLSPREAARFVARCDRGRGGYAKAYFHARAGDDLQYHLVLNTDLIPPPAAVELIAAGARLCFRNAFGGGTYRLAA
jgi:hypothetical protein